MFVGDIDTGVGAIDALDLFDDVISHSVEVGAFQEFLGIDMTLGERITSFDDVSLVDTRGGALIGDVCLFF